MRRNIFCIGDSFVNLPRKKYNEWPEFLADMCPSDNIFNLGWPGAGTEVSISTLHGCIKGIMVKDRSRVFKPDIVILQASDPLRKMYIQEDFPWNYIDNNISFTTKNICTWNFLHKERRFCFIDHSVAMNIGTTLDKTYAKYHKKYTENFLHDVRYAWQWQRSNLPTFVERDMVYVKHLCETNNIKLISYTHVNNSKEHFTDFTIENILGTKKFTNYCVDDGYHFGNEGNKFIANLMKEKI
jgi:hypothetical protein